jgi:large subunit ribosomal protein L7/L12
MEEITKEKVVDWLSNQNIITISNLVKDLEKKWNINVTSQNLSSNQLNKENYLDSNNKDKNTDSSDKKDQYSVFITDIGMKKINLIKEVRSITGLGLRESKNLVENKLKPIKEKIDKEEAESIKKRLESIGSKVELR